MRRGIAIGLLAGWLLGIGTFWAGAALTGGLYRVRAPIPGENFRDVVNVDGCEPFEVRDLLFYRCPRFRLP